MATQSSSHQFVVSSQRSVDTEKVQHSPRLESALWRCYCNGLDSYLRQGPQESGPSITVQTSKCLPSTRRIRKLAAGRLPRSLPLLESTADRRTPGFGGTVRYPSMQGDRSTGGPGTIQSSPASPPDTEQRWLWKQGTRYFLRS